MQPDLFATIIIESIKVSISVFPYRGLRKKSLFL